MGEFMLRRTVLQICLTGFALCGIQGVICADVIRLQHGGEVRGQLEGPAATSNAAPLVIRTLAGAVIEVERTEVDFVQRRSRLMEEYLTKAREIEPTVAAHWELAEWCRAHLLIEQRTEQLELLLDIDSDHADARRILGHVQHKGEWMSRDEMMQQQGYVKHRNRWITTQELALIEKNATQREAELVWYPKVRLWLGWVTGSDAQRRTEGVKNFEGLTDPDSVPALVKSLASQDSFAIRQLYVKTLAQISGRRSMEALLERYLFDSSQIIQADAWLTLRQRGADSELVPLLVKSLSHDSNPVVRRAASALGDLGSEQAIPGLIAALITTHRYKVQVPASQPVSFGRSSNPGLGSLDPARTGVPVELAMLARLGQLPYGVQLHQPHAPPRNMQTVTVRVEVKNEEVLAALEKITSQNHGFNQRDWHLWWSVYKS